MKPIVSVAAVGDKVEIRLEGDTGKTTATLTAETAERVAGWLTECAQEAREAQ